MDIGIEQFRVQGELWIDRMLVQPPRGPGSGHTLDVSALSEMKSEQAIDSSSDKVNVQSENVRE